MEESKRGYYQCKVCGSITHEYVDDWGDSFHKCSNCGTKIRIFHRPIRRTSEKSFDGVGIA